MTDFPCCLCGENGGTWVCRIGYEMTKTRFYTTPTYFLTFSSGIFEKVKDNNCMYVRIETDAGVFKVSLTFVKT